MIKYKILHIPTGLYLHTVVELDGSYYRYLSDYPANYPKQTLDKIFPKGYTFAVRENRVNRDIFGNSDILTAMNYVEFEIIEVKV